MGFLAVAIVVLLGFAGYATDGGMVWISRTRLQNSVDAAALAAAQELPANNGTTEAAVSGVACNYATVRNPVPGMFGKTATCGGQADVTFPDSTTVQVTAYRTVQPIFGQIVGFEPIEVWARATVRIGSLGSSCVFPFFLTQSQVTAGQLNFFTPVKFTDANTAGAAVDVGSGANAVRDAMVSRSCADNARTALGQTVNTKPGALDQFKAGWDQIATNAAASSCPSKHVSTYLTQDAAGRYELSPTITFATCPRLVIVPVLEDRADGYKGGNKSGKVVGFVPFYFALKCDSNSCNDPDVGAMSKSDFWGYYVRLDLSSSTYVEYSGFGTQIIGLAD